MITLEGRLAWLQGMWPLYQQIQADPGRFPELVVILDGYQKKIRHEPIEGDPPLPPPDGRLQYDEPTQVQTASIEWAQSLRGFPAQMRFINALRFVAQKDGVVRLNLAEYQSPATTYQCALSKTAGDLTGAREGNQPDASLQVTAGEPYYLNFRAWSRDIGRTATFEVQTVVVEGAWPA